MIQYLETDCENVFRTSKHWSKISNLREFVKMRHSREESLLRWSYKTIPDVDDGFGDRTPACREHTLPRAHKNSRFFATIPGQTIIGPALQVHIIRDLDISGIKIQIPSTTPKDRTSWVMMCRGKNRYVEELHLNDPDHNPTSSELLEHIELERSVAKEREPGSTKMEPPWSIEETHGKQLKFQTNPVYNYSEVVVPIEERKWNDIPARKFFKGDSLPTENSGLVMRLACHHDQDERETDGAVQWNSMVPLLRNAFQKSGGRNSRTQIGFNTLMKQQD